MLKAYIENKRDHNRLLVTLPCDFADVKGVFKETYGHCRARSEDDFVCLGLHSDGYRSDDCCTSLGAVNAMARSLQYCVANFSERELRGFFEHYNYACLEYLEDGSFSLYNSKEEYLNSLYEEFGLTDTDFLWTTVDEFLNDDDVFDELEARDIVLQASNGVIIVTN